MVMYIFIWKIEELTLDTNLLAMEYDFWNSIYFRLKFYNIPIVIICFISLRVDQSLAFLQFPFPVFILWGESIRCARATCEVGNTSGLNLLFASPRIQ